MRKDGCPQFLKGKPKATNSTRKKGHMCVNSPTPWMTLGTFPLGKLRPKDIKLAKWSQDWPSESVPRAGRRHYTQPLWRATQRCELVTELVSDRAGAPTRAAWLQSAHSCPLSQPGSCQVWSQGSEPQKQGASGFKEISTLKKFALVRKQTPGQNKGTMHAPWHCFFPCTVKFMAQVPTSSSQWSWRTCFLHSWLRQEGRRRGDRLGGRQRDPEELLASLSCCPPLSLNQFLSSGKDKACLLREAHTGCRDFWF